MTNNKQDLSEVTLLGNQNTKYQFDYDPSLLERFKKKFDESIEDEQIVSLDCFEFASRCVTGDTLIDTARDETKYPKGVPIKDLVGTEGYVFTVDPKTTEPLVKRYKDVRCTGVKRPVVKVNMLYRSATGMSYKHESITCTEDHLFLVRCGMSDTMWIQAKDLKSNMRLIANQHNNDTVRHEKIRHRLIGQAMFGEIDGYHIHHIDHNHFNNDPSNLQKITPSRHSQLHRSEQYGYDDILDVDELINLYESGENFESLARMFSCDSSTISSRIGDHIKRRSQAESLRLKNRTPDVIRRNSEICTLYKQGYLIKEISEYMQLHATRISEILKENNISIVESNVARKNRIKKDLPPLNHKIVNIEPAGYADVYNMEVEDTHCYFANSICIHNCPRTNQPDFATIHISYIPNEYMVESKSLKLYLFSYQQHGDFHETCVHQIMQDLVDLLHPKYLEVYGDFNSRGGISILPFSVYSDESHLDLKKSRQLSMMQYSCDHRPRTGR